MTALLFGGLCSFSLSNYQYCPGRHMSSGITVFAVGARATHALVLGRHLRLRHVAAFICVTDRVPTHLLHARQRPQRLYNSRNHT